MALIFLLSRTLRAGEDAVWKMEPGMEECTFPWLYPTGERGELHCDRPITLKFREYCKLRLLSADKRWQTDSVWVFRALNLIQREDLCSAVNYHARTQYKKDRLCYEIYPCKHFIFSCIFSPSHSIRCEKKKRKSNVKKSENEYLIITRFEEYSSQSLCQRFE